MYVSNEKITPRCKIFVQIKEVQKNEFVHTHQEEWYFSLWSPTMQRAENGHCNLQGFPVKSKTTKMGASLSIVLLLPGPHSFFLFAPGPFYLLKVRSWVCFTGFLMHWYAIHLLRYEFSLFKGVQLIITRIFEGEKKWSRLCFYWAVNSTFNWEV